MRRAPDGPDSETVIPRANDQFAYASPRTGAAFIASLQEVAASPDRAERFAFESSMLDIAPSREDW